jgi:hypothetical protein
MTFNISFKITDDTISLNELIEEGYTIDEAEFVVKKMITEMLEDELGDAMTFSCLKIEYD